MRKMLLLTMALMLLGTTAWAQDQGTISGVVMTIQNNDTIPLSHAFVFAFHPNTDEQSATAYSDSLGRYTLNVDFGDYQVRARAINFIPLWYDNVPERSQATILHVTSDNSPAGIDFLLLRMEENEGEISGRIIESGTDHGVHYATVRAILLGNSPDTFITISADDGDYDFDHLATGAYTVDAFKEGWNPGSYPDTLAINNNAVGHIDIALTRVPPPPGHSISGVVTNGITGAPINHARIQAGGLEHEIAYITYTDSLGAYIFTNLQPNRFRISAFKEDFFPGQFPEPVVLDSVDVTGINIPLIPEDELGISGRVIRASDSTGIHEADVFAINVANPERHRHAETHGDGTYRLELAPGEYIVEAVAEGFLRQTYPTHVVVTDSIVPGIDFALVAIEYGSIAGTVTDTAGAPVMGANVEARKLGGHQHRHARTDSTGAYIIQHIVPGNYRVTAYHRGFAPGVFPDTVVVANGQHVTGINIVLGMLNPPFNGTIAGAVTDDSTDAAIDHSFVMAIGQVSEHGHMRHIFRYTFTDSLGAYLFNNLPDVAFKLFAAAHGYMGEFYDNVHHYSDATPVTPNASGINFALQALPMGPRALAGNIETPIGFDPGGSIIYASVDGQIADIVACDPNGDFSFDDIAAGIYNISVFHPEGEASLPNPVDLTYGDAEVTIQLIPTSTGDNPPLPAQLSLHQNYPNPFNAQTLISFNVVTDGNIDLSIFNMIGQKVITLVNGAYQGGLYNVIWDGRDMNGQTVSSGVYYYRLKVGDKSQTLKMTLLK